MSLFRYLICFLVLVEFNNEVVAQHFLQAGITFNIGTHINRIGGQVQYNYVLSSLPIQAQCRFILAHVFRSLGPGLSGLEAQFHAGAMYGFGPPADFQSQNRDILTTLMPTANAGGFTYHIYLDQFGTSQAGGTLHFQFDHWLIAIENDLWGGGGWDRYRTGAFLFGYREQQQDLLLKCMLWTGNASENAPTIEDNEFPSRFGYKNLSKSKFGKFSNGILSLYWAHAVPFEQTIFIGAGIDAEQVRNVFQNRVIHDMYFVPTAINKARNPHYPMLDTDGMPYLYLPDQKIRRAQGFFELGMNPTPFY